MDNAAIEKRIAITSRVRLARNFSDIPFPPMMNDIWAGESFKRTQEALYAQEAGRKLNVQRLVDIPPLQRMQLVEHHRISPALLSRADIAGIAVGEDDVVSVMINEEDHLRIQAILPGLNLGECAKIAGGIDDIIENSADYAFDPDIGYLTSCPTNAGTGLRGSIMLHLPALSMIGQVTGIARAVNKIGLTVRGMYGEGSEGAGGLYQLSNQVTLGRAEEEILENLATTARQVIEREIQARNLLMEGKRVVLEDRIRRAWGVLTNALKIDSKEFMNLWSDVRLGMDLGFLDGGLREELDGLTEAAQPASLALSAGRELDAQERDILRATTAREAMEGAKG